MRSIKELSAEANSYPFSSAVSFPSWIHVCQTLQREAHVYDLESDAHGMERAYILYLRMADLVLNRLPRHPSFSTHKKQYTRVYNQVSNAIARSEALKTRLEARKPEPGMKPVESSAQTPQETLTTSELSPIQEPTYEKDFNAFDTSNFESAQISLDDSMRATLETLKTPHRSMESRLPAQSSKPMVYEYPSVTLAKPEGQARPLKSFLNNDKDLSSPSIQATSASLNPKSVTQPNNSVQHKSVYTTEKGEQLRLLYVPEDLRARFLELARKNTKANLETCGILCGKLNRNAFFITNLVVPHQTSTSDSCDMTTEEELFEYVDKRDLFIVGWIHTHPSQSCFMSSIDLHTQAGYQIMLPEAIAIVCAPCSDPSWGVFRLTDPPGVDIIKNCRLKGFHPHSQPNLYKLATPGHVKEIPFSFEHMDLRDC